MYFAMVSTLTGYKSAEMTDAVGTGELRRHIKEFKQLLKDIWDENGETGL